ncbi:CRE-TAG-279 protein [Caenorhabditis remanei]|uniref:CRE-TAG-279 protein n=1 Tax=Caenorhabditis remanei TaxID=31234 RepID=E3MUE8_CAERE|nr:CRE-TAG-279 protein [Caenorhabditis remanei]
MVRGQGRNEVFEELNKAKKNIESHQKIDEEINDVIGKPKNQKPDEVQSSSVSWITKRTDNSKFCYRCIPLCLDDQKKENDVKKAMVLDLDRYLNCFLYLRFKPSEDFDAQQMFDSAFECQNCPNIGTTSQYVQKCAKLVVLMRQQGRVAALGIVKEANNLAKRQRQTAASRSAGSSNKRHWKNYLNFNKRSQTPKKGPIHSAGSRSDEVTGLGMGEHLPLQGSLGIQCASSVAEFQKKSLEKNQSSSSDPNGTTIATSSNYDYPHCYFLLGSQENQQSGSETSSAISKNAPAPVYPKTGSIQRLAGFNIDALLSPSTDGGNKTNKESDSVPTSSTADTNKKKMTGGKEVDDGNKTEANEQCPQNARVSANPALKQIQEVVTEETSESAGKADVRFSPRPLPQTTLEHSRNNEEESTIDDREPSITPQPYSNKQKAQCSEASPSHKRVDGEEHLLLQGPMEIQSSPPPLTVKITEPEKTDVGQLKGSEPVAEEGTISTRQESSTDGDNITDKVPIPVGTSSTAVTNGKEMTESVEKLVHDGHGKKGDEESSQNATVPVNPALEIIQQDVRERAPESAEMTDERFSPRPFPQTTSKDLRNDEEIPMDEGELSNTLQPQENEQEPQRSEGSPNHKMDFAVDREGHLPLQKPVEIQPSLSLLTVPTTEIEQAKEQLEGNEHVAEKGTTLTRQESSTDGDNIIHKEPIPVETSSTAVTNEKETTASAEQPVDDGHRKKGDEESSQSATVPVNPALEKIREDVTEETTESAEMIDDRFSLRLIRQTSEDLRNNGKEIPMDEGELSNTLQPQANEQEPQRSECSPNQKVDLAVDRENHLSLQKPMEIQPSLSSLTVPTTEIEDAKKQLEGNEHVAEEESPSTSQETTSGAKKRRKRRRGGAGTQKRRRTASSKTKEAKTPSVEEVNSQIDDEVDSQNSAFSSVPAVPSSSSSTRRRYVRLPVQTPPEKRIQLRSRELLVGQSAEVPGINSEEGQSTSSAPIIPISDVSSTSSSFVPAQEISAVSAPVYPETLSTGSNRTVKSSFSTDGDNTIHEEWDRVETSSTADANKKKMTEGQKVDDGNKTKVNEQSPQNALVPVNQVQDKDILQTENEKTRPNSTENEMSAAAGEDEDNGIDMEVDQQNEQDDTEETPELALTTDDRSSPLQATRENLRNNASTSSPPGINFPLNPESGSKPEGNVEEQYDMDFDLDGDEETEKFSTARSRSTWPQKENKKKGPRKQKKAINETEKERKKRELREHSWNWLITHKLMSIHAEETEKDQKKEEKDRVPPIKRARVEKVIKERMVRLKYFKTGENNEGVDSHYMRRVINLETQFPDEEDYRRCTGYLKKLCTEVVSCEEKPRNTKVAPSVPLPPPPRIFLTGPMYHSHNITSAHVLKEAANWSQSQINTLYQKSEGLKRPNPDKKLFEEEAEFYQGDSPNSEEKDKCRRACPVLKVENKEQALSPEFEKTATKAPVTVISGAFKVFDIDTNLFSREEIAKVKPNEEIKVLNQVPQAADQNKSYEGEDTWKVPHIDQKKVKMSIFQKKIEADYENAKQRKFSCVRLNRGFFLTVYNDILESEDPEKTRKILEKCAATMAKFHRPPPNGFYGPNFEKLDRSLPWIRFGSNIDLLKKHYVAQFESLEKLPEFLRPTGGNNLLNQLSVQVLGVNTVQLYVKSCGCRTAAHMENSLMASINWNRGPGSCVWYAIPYEYWGKIEELTKENDVDYHQLDYWPGEDKLVKDNIPFYKFEQHTDELVYLNTGCFHFVQSNGYCENVSWNVGQPTFTQLATSMVAFDHYIECEKYNQVPVIQMVWAAAKNKKFVNDPEMYRLMRNIMIRSLAHTRWYFDYLKSVNYKTEDIPWAECYNPRCEVCGTEVFNIVRYTEEKVKGKRVEHDFCSQCEIPEEYKHQRIKFAFMFSEEDLCDIFDAFVPDCKVPEGSSENGPTPGPSSSLSSQPQTPGPSKAPYVEDKDATPNSPSSSQSQQTAGPSSI